MKRPGRTITTPANVGVLRRKLLEIYDEEDDETQSE